jgi:RNA-binding protein 39
MNLTKDQRTVFVSQLTQKVKEKHLKRYFSKIGKVRHVFLMRNKITGRSKGFAYVEMQELEAIPLILMLNGQLPDFQKFPILIKASEAEKNFIRKQEEAVSTGGGGGGGHVSHPGVTAQPTANRLYVGNLHVNITEDDLRTVFAPFGEIQQIQLHSDEGGRSKGYAFVHFQQVDSANSAMAKINGLELAGKPVKVGMVNESVQTGGESQEWKLDDDEGMGMQMNSQSRAQLMQRLAGGPGGPGDSQPGGGQGAAPPPAAMRSAAPAIVPKAAAGLQPGEKPKIVGTQSHAFVLKNMFDPKTETEPDWDKDIKEDVEEECGKYGQVLHAYVEKDLPVGSVRG